MSVSANVLAVFGFDASLVAVKPLGEGLINHTYMVQSENDFYVISAEGDRYDTLAQQFYSDHTLWWIIASANALPGDSLYPPVGMQLRIPTDVQSVISQYKIVNSKRQYGRF